MARYNYHVNNFSTGQLGKRIQGRKDLRDTVNGLELLQNMIPLRQGGAVKRPGTQFLQDTTLGGSSDEVQLIPYVLNKDEVAMILLDPNETHPTDTAQFKIYEPSGYALSEVFSSGKEQSIEWQNGSGLVSGLTGRYNYAQVASFLFVTHSSGQQPPFVIYKTDTGNYRVTFYVNDTPAVIGGRGFVRDAILTYPFLPPNITPITMTLSGADTTTGSATTLTASDAYFTSDMVGTYFKLNYGADTISVSVTAFSSSTVVTVDQENFAGSVNRNGTPATDWEEAAWSDKRGYPRTVTAFEQRLVWGGNEFLPDTIWASLVGNPFHMMKRRFLQDDTADETGLNYFGDVTVTDPFSYTLSSTQVNAITWMNSADVLQIGTLGAEYIATGGNEILSNSSVSIRKQTSYGGDEVQPVQINNDTIFVSRDGKRMRNFRFNDNNGSYISANMNTLNEEIVDHNLQSGQTVFDTKFVEMTYQQYRDTVWARTSRDELVSLSFDPETGLVAWASHIIAGDDVKIKSVCTIPSDNFNHDDTYLLVERTIDSSTVHYIERIATDFDQLDLNPTANFNATLYDLPFYLDCSVMRNASLGVSGSTVSNLSHLEGQTVRVLADGVDIGEFTVSSSSIDISPATPTAVVVGLTYAARLIPVPVEAGGQFGSSQGLTTKIDRTMIRVYKTREFDLYNIRDGQRQDLSTHNDFSSLADAEFYSGDVKGLTPNNVDDRGQFIVQQENAYPMYVLSLTYRGVSYER